MAGALSPPSSGAAEGGRDVGQDTGDAPRAASARFRSRTRRLLVQHTVSMAPREDKPGKRRWGKKGN